MFLPYHAGLFLWRLKYFGNPYVPLSFSISRTSQWSTVETLDSHLSRCYCWLPPKSWGQYVFLPLLIENLSSKSTGWDQYSRIADNSRVICSGTANDQSHPDLMNTDCGFHSKHIKKLWATTLTLASTWNWSKEFRLMAAWVGATKITSPAGCHRFNLGYSNFRTLVSLCRILSKPYWVPFFGEFDLVLLLLISESVDSGGRGWWLESWKGGW